MFCLALASITYGLRKVWPFTVDDAGIVYAYAKHVAAGQGLRAVVGGPIVEGYSDFLWMLLLVVATKLGFGTPEAAKVLGAALLLWSAVAAACLVRVAGRRQERALGWPEALPAILLGLCPEFVVWAPSGLENSLFGAALLTLLWLDAREAARPALTPWSAVAALAMALTRPEGVVYGALVTAAKLTDVLRSNTHRSQFTRFVALLLAPLAAYHAWHYAVFRELVPNTFFAKAPGSGDWANGFSYVKDGLVATRAVWLIPLALLGPCAGLRSTLPTVGAAAVALAFAVYSRGDWMPHYRFVSLAMPAVATLAAVGVTVVSHFASRRSTRKTGAGVFAFGAVFGISSLWLLHHGGRFDTVRRIRWCHFCSRSEDAANHESARDRLGLREASFLTQDFGGPSYDSSPSFFPIDLLGLADQSAAMIEYRSRRGFTRGGFARLQYFFHEQEEYPTFLYFPDHFWPALRHTPEFQWGYVGLDVPHREGERATAPTRLHRGAFVDFFPPVDRFRFEPLGDRFRLVGASAWRGLPSPSEVEAIVSVSQVRAAAEPVSLRLRIGHVSGPTAPLLGNAPSLGETIGADQPISIHLHVEEPPAKDAGELIEVGVQVAGGPLTWAPLLPVSSVRPVKERPPALPFPSNLPGTSNQTLMELGRELRGLIDERHTRGDRTLLHAGLAEALVTAGTSAEARGEQSDAYLAYVWATQADPDQVRFLHRRIATLRPENARLAFLMEWALLGKFYESRDAFWQLELTAMYVRDELWDKATFFLDRLPPSNRETTDDLWHREASRLRAAVSTATRSPLEAASTSLATKPIPGVASDFEGEPSGWTIHGKGFAVARDDGSRRPVWGIGGKGYFTSELPGEGRGESTGAAESSEFVIDGRALTFVIAGGRSHELSIELVVAGDVKERAEPPGSRCFFPVFWDLRPYRGQPALLRIIDHTGGRDGFIAVDNFEMWPYLGAGL